MPDENTVKRQTYRMSSFGGRHISPVAASSAAPFFSIPEDLALKDPRLGLPSLDEELVVVFEEEEEE